MERSLERELLNLACRHHIHELIVEKAFSSLMPEVSSGPNIKLFQRFAQMWPTIDKDKPESFMEDVENCDYLLDFMKNQLTKQQPRDDDRELLQLALTFLGHTEFTMHAPGAFHRARWMAKIIYGLKIFLFRAQFKLKAKELQGLKRFNHFIVTIYIRYWYESPVARFAPLNDLHLLQELVRYKQNHVALSEATIQVFCRHLWYLSERLVGLAFFDERIPAGEKRAMVLALQKPPVNSQPRLKVKVNDATDIASMKIEDFVCETTSSFFNALGIDTSFLRVDPAEWDKTTAYQDGLRRASSLKVVNDAAERGVALIQDFNSSITVQEDQKQYLLQVVEQDRQLHPTCDKRHF